jgi:hypothetical protein
VILLITFTPNVAQARRGGIPIPIIFGSGEEIDRVGDLPDDVKEQIPSEMGPGVSIGFHYHRFHIYWLNLWTWDGQHVLYQGDRYWKLGPADWEKLLGSPGSRALGKPFFYRFPMGIDILGGLAVLWFLWSTFLPSDRARAEKLLSDERYLDALQLYARQVTPPANIEAP